MLNEFHQPTFLKTDPLSVVYQYTQPKDQEVIALIAAIFSYGNVSSILRTLKQILAPLGETPADRLANFSTIEIQREWKNSYYRFYSSKDIVFLMLRLRDLLKEYQNLENAFLSGPSGPIQSALSHFQKLFLDGSPRSYGQKFMFSNALISPSKRWHMFLRWMVRKDQIDLGLWKRVSKAELLIPLDTHLFQIGRALRLTKRKTPSLFAALEMTEKFRKWDPADPIKYDFALCRLGILRIRKHRLRLATKS